MNALCYECSLILLHDGIDPKLLHFFVERGAIDSQLIGGRVAIPIVLPQHIQDDCSLRSLQSLAKRLYSGRVL